MLSDPQIIQTARAPAAVIHLNIPRSEMMQAFAPAAADLMAELAAQGVTPVGAVFAHHLTMSPDRFDFELGYEVAGPVKARGRVRPGELPAATVARAVYTGPYDGLPSAWSEFDRWMKSQGLEQAHELWEVYSIGPQSTPDSADWRTELNRPLKKAAT